MTAILTSKAVSLSLPSRGAWIEMLLSQLWIELFASLPSRGAWIEICIYSDCLSISRSLPSRGAWIEIFLLPVQHYSQVVAPLAGSVDRNTYPRDIVIETGGRSPRGERG